MRINDRGKLEREGYRIGNHGGALSQIPMLAECEAVLGVNEVGYQRDACRADSD